MREKSEDFGWFFTHGIAVEQEDTVGMAILFQAHVEGLESVGVQFVLHQKWTL